MADYGGFGGIIREAQELAEAERTRPVTACPLCRTRLDFNDKGEANCPLGHYRVSGVSR